jgi:hypothetical protein
MEAECGRRRSGSRLRNLRSLRRPLQRCAASAREAEEHVVRGLPVDLGDDGHPGGSGREHRVHAVLILGVLLAVGVVTVGGIRDVVVVAGGLGLCSVPARLDAGLTVHGLATHAAALTGGNRFRARGGDGVDAASEAGEAGKDDQSGETEDTAMTRHETSPANSSG